MRRSAHVVGWSLGQTLRDVHYIKSIMEDFQEDVFVQCTVCTAYHRGRIHDCVGSIFDSRGSISDSSSRSRGLPQHQLQLQHAQGIIYHSTTVRTHHSQHRSITVSL